jgi:hypothetical protein
MFYVTFKFKAVTGIGTYRGVHLLYNEVPICIEQETSAKAMALANTIGNINRVVSIASVTTEKPSGNDVIHMDRNGMVASEDDHLVTNSDIQSFIWAIKAGIQMSK